MPVRLIAGPADRKVGGVNVEHFIEAVHNGVIPHVDKIFNLPVPLGDSIEGHIHLQVSQYDNEAAMAAGPRSPSKKARRDFPLSTTAFVVNAEGWAKVGCRDAVAILLHFSLYFSVGPPCLVKCREH